MTVLAYLPVLAVIKNFSLTRINFYSIL